MSSSEASGELASVSLEEYRSLRATIQHRGTLRIAIALLTWSVWAVTTLWCLTNGAMPLAGAISLLVLAGGFELVLALHTGVERIGRYVQVAYETGLAQLPAWEHVAMTVGPRWLSPGGLDPLFAWVFLLAALANLLPSLSETSVDVASAVVIHAAFGIRVLLARRFAAKQRAHDLEALKQVISSNALVSRIQQPE